MSNEVLQSPAHDPSAVRYIDRDLWARFAAADTEADFADSWLALQCSMIPAAATGAVFFTKAGERPGVPVATWPRALDDLPALQDAALQSWAERRGVVVEREPDGNISAAASEFAVGYPCTVDGVVRAIVAIELRGAADDSLQLTMRQLPWGVGWLENLLRRQEGDADRGAKDRFRTVLELMATVLDRESFRYAATAFVTELSARLGCDRASLGFMDKDRVEVVALSHSAHFNKSMNLVRSVAAAMEEAIDQRATIVFPPSSTDAPLVTRQHAALAADFGATQIQTVPISTEGEAYAALTVEYGGDTPRHEAGDAALCEAAASFVGPLLREKRRGERSLALRMVDGMRIKIGRLLGPRHFALKLSALLVLAGVSFLFLATGEYRVTAHATVEGEVQRAIVAPFDGYIAESFARAGDKVAAGEVLGRLDDKDLLLEQRNLTSQRGKLIGEYRQALAGHDRANIAVKKASIDQIDAQLALVEEKLLRTRMTAPFEGLVVTGDLSQSLGATVERGQVLFEMAPLDDYRVILQVDERDIADVVVGQSGSLVLSSLPDQRFRFSVAKITPVAESEEGQNFFRVEARLEDSSERLRPGMEGVSKIGIGNRKLAWIWTHRLTEWARLWSWLWLP